MPLSACPVVTNVLVWLMLLYALAAAALAAAADVEGAVELIEPCRDGMGCVGGDGMGRVTDLGEVEEVERERVDVTGREADWEVCEAEGDCCVSAMRNVVDEDETDGS